MPDVEKPKFRNETELIDHIRKNEKGVNIKDGIYDVSDIDFIRADELDKQKDTFAWIKSHDKFWVGNAYATYTIFLFAEEPRKFEGDWDGSGFNYGSTNMINNCPKTILILAEDD